MKARVPVQPGFDLGVFVGGIIVQNHMNLHAGRGLRLDFFEKAQPFLMPVPGRAFRQDFPVEIIQRGKQGDRAMAIIVVGAGAKAGG